jgi:hypothetical protein
MSHPLSYPEQENAVVGYVIAAGFRDIADPGRTRPQDFTSPLRSVIYATALALHRMGKKANALTIAQAIEDDKKLLRDAKGYAAEEGFTDWKDYLAAVDSSLSYDPEGGQTIVQYLGDIAEAAGRRKAAEIGSKLANAEIEPAEAAEALVAIQGGVARPPRFADFKPILEGGFKRETPSVCEAMPGKFLLYSGRINEFHGESGIGKTNISLAIASRIMDAGGIVLFLDPEDNPQGIAQRFIALGGNPDHLLSRFKYVHNPEPADYPGLIEWAKQTKPTGVFLDGMAEALVAEGYNEDKAEDVLPFLRQRIRPFADAGAAVAIADHVTKNKENRGRNPRGSGGKMGRYDGAVYVVELVKAYSPETAGAVRLIVAKDRNGGVGHVGQRIAELHFAPTETGLTQVSFALPQDSCKPFMPTGLMEKVSLFVESCDLAPSKNAIEHAIHGKNDFKRQAISSLVQLGFLKEERDGRGLHYSSVKPFREKQFSKAA